MFRPGDLVLCRVADLMRAATRAQDTVARVGGDEFVLVLPSIEQALVDSITDELLGELQAFQIGGLDLTVGASPLRSYPAGDTRTDGVQIDAILGRGVELRKPRLVDPGTVTDHRAWVATLAIPADTL